ncbi:MAG: ABC transporter permease subunit [Chloroflexi bacterium]|nr:ABC transporter permease subunit [Chloroflexota bacterium]
MRNIWTIAKREYDHYFISPIAFVVAFIILFSIGIYFVYIVRVTSQQALFGGAPTPDITPITWLFTFLLVFTTPALTMRLISEEARMGTLELMLTAPVRDFELVAGKWLGGMLLILTILAVTAIYPILLNSFVDPGIDLRLTLSAYLGVVLVAASFLALGVGISAVFTNQFAAFFTTFGLFFLIWFMMALPANLVQGSGGDIFRYIDMSAHFLDSLNQGIINLSDLVYYISLIALGLFTGTVAVEMRRWR